MKKAYLFIFFISIFFISIIYAENNNLVPYRDGNKCGYADRGMNIKVKPQYEACGDMIDGMASVLKNGKFGFIDNTGKTIVQPVYASSSSINEGHAIIEFNNKYAVINSKGDPVIPFTEFRINSFSNGAAVISKDYIYGLMEEGGKILLPVKFARLDPAGKSFYIAAEPGKPGSLFAGKNFLYDSKGALVLNQGYDLIYPAANDYMKIKNGSKWGYASPDGKIIAPAIFDNIRNIKSDGTACFLKNGKWGIISGKGTIIVEPQYDDVQGGDGTIDEVMQSVSGYFVVSINGDYGIVSAAGVLIAPARYMLISPSKSGYSIAYRKPDGEKEAINSMGLTVLDKNGAELFPPKKEYNIAGEEGDGLIPAGKRGSYGSKKSMGYIKLNGESAFWSSYDEASNFVRGFAIVKKGGKYGIINSNGSLVEDCKFEELTRSSNYPGLFEGYISGAKVYLEPGGKHFWK